jgi:hypothetical protein
LEKLPDAVVGCAGLEGVLQFVPGGSMFLMTPGDDRAELIKPRAVGEEHLFFHIEMGLYFALEILESLEGFGLHGDPVQVRLGFETRGGFDQLESHALMILQQEVDHIGGGLKAGFGHGMLQVKG